jgi:Domain of unknown function (DUF4360)
VINLVSKTKEKKKMKKLIVISGLLFGAASAFADPNPNEVFFTSLNYAGSGCPAGSVSESISTDAKAFTLLFDSYIASVGPGVPITESRKNCQINANMHIPQGWSFSITSIDYRGYGKLDAGVKGLQKSNYYFQGSLAQASAQTTFTGPMDKDYTIRDTIPMANLVWSSCTAERNLNINSQVRLTKGSANSQGLLTIDSIDGQVQQIYHLAWRQCP